ncbi:hypothetical protein DFH06DRAFT_1422556 [Mycena polygramma]|nr:hypothetical protein DFH06DRAFT_1422556 [Mycena polygramma]
MRVFVPVELVREIIAYILVFPPTSLSDTPGTNLKPKWSLISSFSVASKTYRTLALEAWFRALFTKAPADLVFLQDQLQEAQSWIQEMHCVSTDLPLSDIWDLAGFRRLQVLRLDCPSISYRKLPFSNIPASVTELELRGMTWPSPFVFQTVAAMFPQLRTLRVAQHRIWCGLCHTCSTIKFADPVPPKVVYKKGLGLPIHYARALSALQDLHTVSIAVPYSSGNHIRLNPDDPDEDLWAGECDRCVGIMYEDTNFRERWIARKKGVALPGAGSSDSERLYIKPPALETVEWTFWNKEIGDEDEDEEEHGDEDEDEDEPENDSDEAEEGKGWTDGAE